jgi:hypothetical protein
MPDPSDVVPSDSSLDPLERSGSPGLGETPTPRFEPRPHALGTCLVAQAPFLAGEIVSRVSFGPIRPLPDRFTVQVGSDAHGELVPTELKYMNHHCDPNVALDVEHGVVRALKPIAPGDELTFFYPSTEWHMDEPFDCGCESAWCQGRITGAKDVPELLLRQYVLSPVIRSRLTARDQDPEDKT